MVDFLKTLLSDFDPAMLLPDLWAIFDKLDVALRILVLTGPLCLLGLGLMYLLAPPKEANRIFGYQHFWGMSSIDAWRFTQNVAGGVWALLGAFMTIAMALNCNTYRDMAWEAMLLSALFSVIAELLFVIISTFLINALVILHFDRKGVRRGTQE